MQIDQEDNSHSYHEYISNMAKSVFGIYLLSSTSIDSNPDLEADISVIERSLM